MTTTPMQKRAEAFDDYMALRRQAADQGISVPACIAKARFSTLGQLLLKCIQAGGLADDLPFMDVIKGRTATPQRSPAPPPARLADPDRDDRQRVAKRLATGVAKNEGEAWEQEIKADPTPTKEVYQRYRQCSYYRR
jgi:hypothetical protein